MDADTPADEPQIAVLTAAPPRLRTGGVPASVVIGVTMLVMLALWGATVAGRFSHSPPAVLAFVVTFLPYLYAALAAWTFALWCAFPDRVTTPLVLLAVLGSGGLLWGPSFPARTQTAEGDRVRLMEWNVRRLWGGSSDGGDAETCVVDAIHAAGPQVVALLEVSQQDVQRLEARLGMRCFQANYLGTDSSTAGGLAACARGPDWDLRDARAVSYVDDDQWRYVFSELVRGDRVFNLLAVHLRPYAFSGARRIGALQHGEEVVRTQGAQSRALLDRIARFRDPTVVAGDFNSTRDAALHATLRRHMTDAWERGARGLGPTIRFLGLFPLRVDYVYTTDAFAVEASEVLAVDCSDHRPVVTDLVLRSGTGG